MAQITFNSEVWDTEYGFKVMKGGIRGRWDLPAPRDDGFDWPADADTPVSAGMSDNIRDIIVIGRISQSSHANLLTKMASFLNDMLLYRDAATFYQLEFSDSTSLYWNAKPYSVITNFIGSEFNSKYAQVTVSFKCHNDIGVST